MAPTTQVASPICQPPARTDCTQPGPPDQRILTPIDHAPMPTLLSPPGSPAATGRHVAARPPAGQQAPEGHSLPCGAGLGYKPCYRPNLLSDQHDAPVSFIEIHAENYLSASPALHADLTQLRERYPLSIHGVSLSLGGADPLDQDHLKTLKALLSRHQPAVFSEHLAWSTHGGCFFNDLLPVAYDQPTLLRVAQHIDQAQQALQRRILLENPSTYLLLDGSCSSDAERSSWSEPEFLRELVRRTGCGLLLDVNNLYVSAINHGRKPLMDLHTLLDGLPAGTVGEIHLAGHDRQTDSLGEPLLIDHHGAAIAAEVWALYDQAIATLGSTPTLIERDQNLPPWGDLAAELNLVSDTLQAAKVHA